MSFGGGRTAAPSDERFLPLCPSAAYTVRDQERMKRATNYFRWQHRLCAPQLGKRVLEIGCGLGNFTQYILDRELVVAIDVEPSCLEALRRRFPDRSNLIALTMDASSPRLADLKKYAMDSVVCLNVLEHIPDDRLVLEHMHSLLPVGGRVVLMVPAFPSLYGPIDAHLGHYRRYERKSLIAVVRAVGFEPVLLRYMNLVGFFGWWMNARVLKRTEQADLQIAIFDRWVVPILSRVEDLVPPPFGQSLFVVLEKRPRAMACGESFGK